MNEPSSFKIIDFGISTKYNIHSSSIETINHYRNNDELSLVGTVGYIAPEMYKCIYNLSKKNKYNQTVDIYSFGIVLLEMVMHQRAFSLDLSDIEKHVQTNLQSIENHLKQYFQDDIVYLKTVNDRLENSVLKNKKYEKLKLEIQEKIDLIHQMGTCDFEDQNSIMGELMDKNKSIVICCKRFTSEPDIHLLDQKTNEEHSMILQLKDLQNFSQKIRQYEKKTLEERIEDILIYPILFIRPDFIYPRLLYEVQDTLLVDFLQKCLHKDPSQRWAIKDLLLHEWILSS